ncbi:MAG: hypothetical protein Q7T30_04155 [Planctomycetota bacterium]|nr:hypothetical protein [Planctomycetota bacterium]
MFELAWFAAGAAATIAATQLLRGHLVRRNRVSTPPAARDQEPAGSDVDAEVDRAATRRLAISLAEELADLASGVEGSAHSLIENAPDRATLPAAAERLGDAVQRLRTLHSKLIAFGQGANAMTGPTDLDQIVSSMTDELQRLQLGLELQWDPPTELPSVATSPEIVRLALLFACSALLRAEHGATHLSIEAEVWLANAEPWIQIELALEWVAEAEGSSRDLGGDVGGAVDRQAATNLVRSQGGEVTFTHLPGRSARALLRLPAAQDPATAEPALPVTLATAAHAPVRHRYGGALVLEADPSIRAMLADELKATGRAVFACADGASARSFLEATPERFELLIVDHRHRLDAGDPLGQTIQSLAPRLKICVLSPRGEPLPGWPAVHCIRKPFGVHELRAALATVLAG